MSESLGLLGWVGGLGLVTEARWGRAEGLRFTVYGLRLGPLARREDGKFKLRV